MDAHIATQSAETCGPGCGFLIDMDLNSENDIKMLQAQDFVVRNFVSAALAQQRFQKKGSFHFSNTDTVGQRQ